MNTGSRVHPHSHHSYREDLDFELPYTLEQARWSEHRLKIGLPALAVVKLERRTKAADTKGLQKEQVQFIRQKLHIKECARFVQDKSSKSKIALCHCGEQESKHFYTLQLRQPVLGEDVSYGNYNLSFQPDTRRPSRTPLPTLLPVPSQPTQSGPASPQRPYDSRTDIQLHPTNSFGKIEFLEDDIRKRKPAKYVRVADTDSADDVITLMMNYWRMGEPKMANLVITVIGGAKNFKLDGRMREIFNRGLMKAARTTSAWLITSGCNMGVMKAVGDALREGQSFNWGGADGAAHQVRAIGIAPWGYVDQRETLVDFSGEGSWPAHYKPYTKIQHGRPVSLNPDHTHFLLVDDGKRGKYGGVADFRAKLERKISSPERDGGLGIPLVLLVVEGGTDAINDCFESLKHNVPAVICEGTGRAADIIAYAYNNHKLDLRANKRLIKPKHVSYLKLLILQAYGSTWNSNTREENNKTCETLVDKVIKCCEKEHLITIFNMNHHHSLDRAILNALLKGQGATEPEQVKDQLQLALTWNRSDIAADKILIDNISWETGSLDSIMTQALMEDKVDFVKLLMQNGVVMQEYLTQGRLEELYNKAPSTSHFRELVRKAGNGQDITLNDVSRVLMKFLRTHKDTFYNQISPIILPAPPEEVSPNNASSNVSRFADPNKELFIWAILLNKQELARFIWERCDHALPAAIAAACIFKEMAAQVPSYDSELREDYLQGFSDFEALAVQLSNECFESDIEKACMLMEQRHSYWGKKNCLQMAALGENRKFLATQVAQTVLNSAWKRGIRSSNSTIFFSVFCPILVFCKIRYDNLGLGEGDSGLSNWQKIVTFYRAPVTKFITNTMFYIGFLALYSYMVLFELTISKPPGLAEIVVWLWALSMAFESGREAFSFGTLGLWQRLVLWFRQSVWNKADLMKLIIFLVCFILRLLYLYLPGAVVEESPAATVQPPLRGDNREFFNYLSTISSHWMNTYESARYLYNFNIVLVYMSLLRTYTASSDLGPYLLIIGKMFRELSFFMSILAIPVLAFGVAVQGLLFENSLPNWNTIMEVLYIPYMQIFGEINTGYLSGAVVDGCNGTASYLPDGTYCPQYNWLVYVLLAGYLLLVNVLLLNLIIAVFNNIYNSVSENSLEIWKYDMFYLVEEYDRKPVLPPPLIVIEFAVLLMLKLLKKSGCRKRAEGSPYKEQHNDLLRIFEKEMLQRYLTRLKEEETSTVETKVTTILRSSKEMNMTLEELAANMQLLQQADFDDQDDHEHKAEVHQGQRGPGSQWPSPVEAKLSSRDDDLWKKASVKVIQESKESKIEMEETLLELEASKMAALSRRRASFFPAARAADASHEAGDTHKRRVKTKDRLKYLEEKMEYQDRTIKESLRNIEELLKSTILGRSVTESNGVGLSVASSGGQIAAAAAAGAQATSAIELSNMAQKMSYD